MDYRPNTELTASERYDKQKLKRLLKQQHTLYKLTTRLKQAVKRKDDYVDAETRLALETLFVRKNSHNISNVALRDVLLHQGDDNNDARERAVRRFVEGVYFQLQQSWGETPHNNDDDDDDSCETNGIHKTKLESPTTSTPGSVSAENSKSGNGNNFHCRRNPTGNTSNSKNHNNPQYTARTVKEGRILEARVLLRDMTRGTQCLVQFENAQALQGYTRHKFVERAMLIATALCKLLCLLPPPQHSHPPRDLLPLLLQRQRQPPTHDTNAVDVVVSPDHDLPSSNRLPPPLGETGSLLPENTTTTTTRSSSCTRSSTIDDHHHHRTTMMTRLRTVRSVCSIGCGPGCDVVGLVAFLRMVVPYHFSTPDHHHQPPEVGDDGDNGNHDDDAHGGGGGETRTKDTAADNKNAKVVVLDRIVCADWAMVQWNPMVQTVKNVLLVQQQLPHQQQQQCPAVRQMESVVCDVRAPILNHDNCWNNQQEVTGPGNDKKPHCAGNADGVNSSLLSLLLSQLPNHRPSLPQQEERKLRWSTDLVIVSYLLSETREKWPVFFDDLVDLSAAGTLFLLTDPTAWQLHLFRERYEFGDGGQQQQQQPKKRRRMEFIWLDSSMYRPELQELEGRNGPAVLLGMKVGSEA